MAGILSLTLALCAWGQTQSGPEQGPGKQIGSGAGDIGIGAAKGAGNLAKGTGKGAVDLVTLHLINAGAAVGHGALTGVQDVAEGTTKGSVKVAHGIGRAFKKLF